MTETMWRTIAFLGGILTGVGLGYLLADKKLGAHYQAIADEEIEKFKEEYGNRSFYNDVDAPPEELDTTEEGPEEVINLHTNEQIIAKQGYKPDEDNSISYDELRLRLTPPDTQELVEADPGPFVISEKQYSEENLWHDKVTWRWHEDDDVLANEDEEIVTDRWNWMPEDALYELTSANRSIFIRNSSISTDIEVVYEPNSYAHVVYGLDEPKEPKIRKMRREYDD